MSTVVRLLEGVRRRLRWTWTVATWQWAAPAVVLLAGLLVGVGWLRPWAWPERAALGVAVAGVVLVAVVGLVVRIPRLLAARAADRGLRTHDAFAAALELEDDDGEFAGRVRTRAASLAAGAKARDAIPLPVASRRRLGAIGVMTSLVVAFAFLPNPQDDERARLADEAARRDAAAEDLREAAEEARTPEAKGALEALAEELERADSMEEAAEVLAEGQSVQESQVSPNQLATKAATQGLERSLEANPLSSGTTGSAAEQMSQLAEQLKDMSAEEQEALAERLEELAGTQTVGNPDAAEALSEAAAALAAGDVATAEAALGEAAAAQSDALSDAAASDAASAASDAIGEAAESLGEASGEAAAQGEGNGEPCPDREDDLDEDGDGDRDEDGDVDEDDDPCVAGSGNGSGNGNGGGGGGSGGQQGGQGGGSPSGDVAGADGGTGSGQGGQGQSSQTGTGGDENTGQEGGESDGSEFESGDQMEAGGGSGQGRPGQTQGRTTGPSRTGQAGVAPSLQDAFEQGLSRARDGSKLSPTMRDIFSKYWDNLNDLYGQD